MGHLLSINGPLYQWADISLKGEYSMNLEVVATTMDEILDHQSRHAAMVISKTLDRTARSRNKTASENFVRIDGSFVIQTGYTTTVYNVKDVRRITNEGSRNIYRNDGRVSSELRDDRMRLLITSKRENISDNIGASSRVAHHFSFCLPASEYVSGYQVPTVRSGESGTTAIL